MKALIETSPGKNLAGQGDVLSWPEFCQIFTKLSGLKLGYHQLSVDELENVNPGASKELADMFTYIEKYGYFGGDPSVIFPDQVSRISSRTSVCQLAN